MPNTIRDVAKAAGVSTSTVSHVINESRYVSPEVRERVMEAMANLSYSPNRLARSLRNRQTHILGVLLPNNTNPFFAEVLLGVEAACFELGFNIIMGNANDDQTRELTYLDVLLSRQVDGVVLISTGAYDQSLDLLIARQTPVVMVDRAANVPHVDEIFTDNEQGGLLATRYLLSLGHRRIGCIAGPSFLSPSANRVAGYRQAQAEQGITPDPALIVQGDFQHQGGYRACQQLLQLTDRPTALFACNDLMAVGALYAVHEAGLRVPDDISLVGYDDIPLASYTVPRLTTIAQPGRETGRIAVEQLVSRLENPTAPARHHMLAVQLIERDSCRRLSGETEK